MFLSINPQNVFGKAKSLTINCNTILFQGYSSIKTSIQLPLVYFIFKYVLSFIFKICAISAQQKKAGGIT